MKFVQSYFCKISVSSYSMYYCWNSLSYQLSWETNVIFRLNECTGYSCVGGETPNECDFLQWVRRDSDHGHRFPTRKWARVKSNSTRRWNNRYGRPRRNAIFKSINAPPVVERFHKWSWERNLIAPFLSRSQLNSIISMMVANSRNTYSVRKVWVS